MAAVRRRACQTIAMNITAISGTSVSSSGDWNDPETSWRSTAPVVTTTTASTQPVGSSHGTRCSGHSQRLAASSAIIDPVPLATNHPDHFRAELGPQPGDVDVDHV